MRGSARHWHRYEVAYLLMAGLATPLVVSVHTVVSFDFAVAIVPGWHSTIFPPYFVAGAIFSGFAMVLTLAIPIRAIYGLQGFITLWHLENMAKILLVTGLCVAYGYLMEAFMAWYSGDIFEQQMMANRMFGPYGWIFWGLMLVNVLIPQALWSRRVRTQPLTVTGASFGAWQARMLRTLNWLRFIGAECLAGPDIVQTLGKGSGDAGRYSRSFGSSAARSARQLSAPSFLRDSRPFSRGRCPAVPPPRRRAE